MRVKQRSECGQRFPFPVSELKQLVSVVSEEKQRIERSQRFPFNSSEVKQRSECSQ